MSIREEIFEFLKPYELQTITPNIIQIFEKRIDEELDNLNKKIKDKELFLDGMCIDSSIRMLEKIKVLLK